MIELPPLNESPATTFDLQVACTRTDSKGVTPIDIPLFKIAGEPYIET
jgi:hypothetical protein